MGNKALSWVMAAGMFGIANADEMFPENDEPRRKRPAKKLVRTQTAKPGKYHHRHPPLFRHPQPGLGQGRLPYPGHTADHRAPLGDHSGSEPRKLSIPADQRPPVHT